MGRLSPNVHGTYTKKKKKTKVIERSLEERVDWVLHLTPSKMHPHKMRSRYNDRDWELICRGRKLALDGVKKVLRGEV